MLRSDGIWVKKYGMSGSPKRRKMQLENIVLTWGSSKSGEVQHNNHSLSHKRPDTHTHVRPPPHGPTLLSPPLAPLRSCWQLWLFKITRISKGKTTERFYKTGKKANYLNCFSLYTEERTLDVECQSQQMRDDLISALLSVPEVDVEAAE